MAMTLDDIDEAVTLRNHRAKAVALADASKAGWITCEIKYNGLAHDPFSVIAAHSVRAAISKSCAEFIAEKDARLAELGISVDPQPTP